MPLIKFLGDTLSNRQCMYFYLIYVPKVSDYLCNYSKSCLSLAECNDMDGCSLGENDMSDMTENKYQYN